MSLATYVELMIEPGECWGRLVGEDSDEGACDLCCRICSDAFEKPDATACARVRSGVDLWTHLSAIETAVKQCPVSAIRLRIAA